MSLAIFLGAAARVQAQSPAGAQLPAGAPSPAELVAIVSVEGIEDAAGYAAVTAWLESTVSPQGLSVEEAGGSTVVYRIRTQGDLQQLAAALGAHPRLRPLPSTNPASLGFRYSP